MHGLYLSRACDTITELARDLLGLHCWFHRNVAFSALIRGAALSGWKHALTKTWVHHALHGVAPDDLPTLLAVHAGEWRWGAQYRRIADQVIRLMEDGVYSRAEMRVIFAHEYDQQTISHAFSPWGGVFYELARMGKVAFRDMTSRDFDLIDAEPAQSFEQVLPGLFHRFLAAYGPATLADAAWFFGLARERKKMLSALNLEAYARFEHQNTTYYQIDQDVDLEDIPQITLLSGFDPLIVSYTQRDLVLPAEYKKAVILKSGICLPTIAIDGQVAGLWNIKKGAPVIELFSEQPKYLKDRAFELAEWICRQTAGVL